jgi:hypothetical protein
MTFVRALVIPAALFAATLTAGCSVPQSRIGIDAPPEDQFAAMGSVGDYLDHRCGTIDCHGQQGRNLRMWGCWGLRLDVDAVASCIPPIGVPTTLDEYNATYRSLVGLEPAVMSTVVQTHATNPELLTFIRKARGLESHKGGHLVTPGDPQDTCMVSWLAGNTDMMACQMAQLHPTFNAPAPPTQPASP